MKDEKKSLEGVLPKEELKNSGKYADHLKSPMHELEDKKETTLKDMNGKASQEEEE